MRRLIAHSFCLFDQEDKWTEYRVIAANAKSGIPMVFIESKKNTSTHWKKQSVFASVPEALIYFHMQLMHDFKKGIGV